MLNFIYGIAGSGKTTYINNMIKDIASKGEEEIILIVPEQFSFSAERKMLELLGPVDCNRVEVVMSFTHIADSVYKLYGGNKLPELSTGGKSMLMSMAVDAVSDNYELYRKNSNSKAFLDDMLSLSMELRRGNYSAENLDEMREKTGDEFLKKKLHDISLTMSAYDALLNNRYFDPDDKLTILAKDLEEYPFFENKTVFIDGFTGFTGQEYEIIKRILNQSKQMYITVCCDRLFKNEEFDDIFSPAKKTASMFYELANKCNVPVKIKEITKEGLYKSKEIETLQRELYSLEKSPECESEGNIVLFKSKNKLEECEYVACEIKRLLRQGYRCRDISVVSRNGGDYETYMRSALDKCGVPVFIDKRSPVYSQPLCTFVKSALDIAVSGFSTQNVLKYMKTGLAGIDLQKTAELERYALAWKIKGSKWKKPFEENPAGMGQAFNDKEKALLRELNEIRVKLINPLDSFCRNIKSGADGRQASKLIYQLLIEAGADKNLRQIAEGLYLAGETELACQQERIWDTVMSVLDDMAKLIGDRVKPVEDYRNLIEISLKNQTLGNIPQGLDEVTVGDAMRTMVNEPKVIFILGANDGVFPSWKEEKGAFSDKEIKVLRSMGLNISETPEENISEERFLVYKTLCSPSDKLYISCSMWDYKGSQLQESEIFGMIKNIFGNISVKDTSEMSSLEFIESEQTAFIMTAAKWNDNDTHSSSLKEYFNSREDYRGKMAALETLAGKKEYKFKDTSLAQEFFGKNLYESPTAVESFHKCPFSYFCKFGMRIRTGAVGEIDPRNRGNIVHYALENLIKDFSIHGLGEMSDITLKEEIRNILREYADDFMGGLENKSERFNDMYKTFEKTLFSLIKQLVAEFSVSGFEPVDFELSIDKDGEIKPYEIRLDDGSAISLRGKIDRVDKLEHGGKTYIRVIDYKTGGKDFVLSDVLEGLNMQMLAYLFTLWENGEEKYGEVVPAGVLYMTAGDNVANVSRNSTEEEIDREHKKSVKLNGIVLNSTYIIEAMEHDGKGIFIPAKINSKGEGSGNVISLEQLKKLKKRVDSILGNMASELHSGNINALPVYGKDYKEVCKYCDFKDICRIEEDDERRVIEKFTHSQTLEMLDEDKEAEENVGS